MLQCFSDKNILTFLVCIFFNAKNVLKPKIRYSICTCDNIYKTEQKKFTQRNIVVLILIKLIPKTAK